ncbi:hypothetical protein CNR22_22345 [Sphingobacteriaceae bacterium]|nr:hypothetical protein CNR22_22345 [Sphingobacteriaceae bacterium]
MKKGLKIFLVCFVLVAAVGGYFFFHPKRALDIIIPKFENIENVHITPLSDTLLIDADVQFENKSIFKLTIDSFIYHVKLDTLTLLSKSQNLNIKMLPSTKDTVRLPVSLPFKRLSKEIKNLQDQDSVDITYDLRVVYSTWLGKANLPYKKTVKIAVPIPPKFEIEKLDYKKREKNLFYFDAYVKVINKGKLDLHLSDIKYKLTVKENLKVEGKDDQDIHLKPGTETLVVLPITVEFKHLLKTLVSVVTDNDKVNYHLKVTGMARMDKISTKKTPVEIEKKGITELKK